MARTKTVKVTDKAKEKKACEPYNHKIVLELNDAELKEVRRFCRWLLKTAKV